MVGVFVCRRFERTFEMFYLGEVVYLLGYLHNLGHNTFVLGIEIAQQSNSCGDNCTPQ